MKKKSFLSLVLAVVLMIPCAFLMTACGNMGGDDKYANISLNYIEEIGYYKGSSEKINVEVGKTYYYTFTTQDKTNAEYVEMYVGYNFVDNNDTRIVVADSCCSVKIFNGQKQDITDDETKVYIDKVGGDDRSNFVLRDIEANETYYVEITFTDVLETEILNGLSEQIDGVKLFINQRSSK